MSAKSALMIFSVTIPEDAEILAFQGSGLEVQSADATTLSWESLFIGQLGRSFYDE